MAAETNTRARFDPRAWETQRAAARRADPELAKAQDEASARLNAK